MNSRIRPLALRGHTKLAIQRLRRKPQIHHQQLVLDRRLHLASVLIPPAIFVGLFISLWTWKCTMLVLFQNVIIYNPFLPPDARSLKIADFASQCGGIKWREERIQSLDGTEIALCVANIQHGHGSMPPTRVYIMYFQGNASSLPPRLPDISSILRMLETADMNGVVDITVVCVSYRGYWTSHDRPSERRINMDTEAALQWTYSLHDANSGEAEKRRPVFILWGQSIGCGFASNLAASVNLKSNLGGIDALVLETPFTNTRAMLKALYPQKWLPYQYLWPFLRNHLDTWKNLSIISAKAGEANRRPGIYIVEAGKDELVPSEHGLLLYQRCQDVGLLVEKRTVRGAYHNEASVRRDGKQAIAKSIASAIQKATSDKV